MRRRPYDVRSVPIPASDTTGPVATESTTAGVTADVVTAVDGRRRITRARGLSANGFRPGRGGTDCLALFRWLLEQITAKEYAPAPTSRPRLHAVFADLAKAFDHCVRVGIWTVLRQQGCPEQFVDVLKSFHEGMECRVRCDGSVGAAFPCRTGVRQGCLMAPYLLNALYGAALAVWRDGLPDGVGVRFAFGAAGRLREGCLAFKRNQRAARAQPTGRGWAEVVSLYLRF